MGHATLFSIFMAKVKIIYHFSACKRVLEDTSKENDCICVISYFRLSSRTRLSCVAGGGFLGRRKKFRGHARGEKERRPPPPFACSSRAACTLGLGTWSVAWVVTSSKPLLRSGSEGLDRLDWGFKIEGKADWTAKVYKFICPIFRLDITSLHQELEKLRWE